MRDKQEKLLLALREIEEEVGAEFTRDELLERLAKKTGYKDRSLPTYLTKNFMGVLVHVVPGSDRMKVRGAIAIDEELFALLMSQNNLLKEAAQNKQRWREITQALERLGKVVPE